MRKYILSFFVFFVFFYVVKAQENKSIVPVINQTADYIDLIEKKYNKQVVHLEYDVIKTSKQSYRKLFTEVQYGIIVFGDGNISDVNMSLSRIEEGKWKSVDIDDGDEEIVMLFFTPKTTSLYRFEIESILINENSFGFYSFIIFR